MDNFLLFTKIELNIDPLVSCPAPRTMTKCVALYGDNAFQNYTNNL